MPSKFSIKAIFAAEDRMSAKITKMQKGIGRFTRKLERGFKAANHTVSKFIGKLKTGFLAGAAAVAAAASAIGFSLKEVADRADNLAKTSRILEFPIEELQQWQFVAKQSGIANAEFNKSLEIMSRQVGQAKAGTGSLITILRKMNPQLLKQIVHTKNNAKAFELFINAMRNTTDASKRAAIANAAFGKQGAKLINIAKTSTKEIEKLKKQQRDNGIITEKQAKAAEAYNDAMSRLQGAIGGVIQDALLPLLPLLTQGAEKLRQWILKNRELIKIKITEFFEKIRQGIVFILDHQDSIIQWTINIGKLLIAFKLLGVALRTINLLMALNPWVALGLTIAGVTLAVVEAVKHWDELKKAFPKTTAAIENTINFFKNLKQIINEVIDSITKLSDKFNLKFNLTLPGFSAASKLFREFNPFSSSNVASQTDQNKPATQLVSPAQRTAAAVSETTTTNKSEVTIKDESNKAEVTKGFLGQGIKLIKSGVF